MSEIRFSPDFSAIEGPHVFIQWKGTDVCLDFWCECGAEGHFDGDFAYHLHCGKCNRNWTMPHSVSLQPMPEQKPALSRYGPVVKDVEMDEDL